MHETRHRNKAGFLQSNCRGSFQIFDSLGEFTLSQLCESRNIIL